MGLEFGGKVKFYMSSALIGGAFSLKGGDLKMKKLVFGNRRADNGQFTSKAYAEKHKKTTVREVLKKISS